MTLYMMIGLPGSGKTAYTNYLPGFVHSFEITKEKHFSLKYNHFYILFFTFDFKFKTAIYILQKNSIFATEKYLIIQYHFENYGAGGKTVDKPPCTQQFSKKQNYTPTIS